MLWFRVQDVKERYLLRNRQVEDLIGKRKEKKPMQKQKNATVPGQINKEITNTNK